MLKIIGIVLAVLIGILLVVCLSLLFVPLRYEMRGTAKGDYKSVEIYGKIHWFFYLFSGNFQYQEGKMRWKVRVLWRELKRNQNIPGEKSKKTKKKTYTFQKLCDMIKSYQYKKESLLDFITDEIHLSAWNRLKREFVRLFRIIRPRKIRVDVCFGCEDSAATGKTLALLSMLYPFYGDNIQITPDFENEILKGYAIIKGRIHGLYALIIAWNLFFDKDIQKTLKDIRERKW